MMTSDDALVRVDVAALGELRERRRRHAAGGLGEDAGRLGEQADAGADLVVVDGVDAAAARARGVERVGAVGRGCRSPATWRSSSGVTGRQKSWPSANAVATGEQPVACAPFIVGSSPSMSPRSSHSWKPLAIFVNSEPEAIGATHAVRRAPAELLGDLVRERLGALGVVRAHVDVHERPVALARQLGAEAVDVVVVAPDLHEVRPVDAGREDLLLLEIGRDEDVGLHAERGAVGGDAVGEVAGRGARERLEAELAGARGGDRHDAVLEGVRGVRRVVLHPHLAQAEALGEPVGADQRRAAGGQARARGQAGRRAGRRLRAGGSRRSARCSAARPGCGGAASVDVDGRRGARRRPPAARSTARRRTAPRARTPPRTHDTSTTSLPSETLRGYHVAEDCNGLGHICQELAPCPTREREPVAGVSQGQSLHPSGCVQLCGPQDTIPVAMNPDEPRSPDAEPATAKIAPGRTCSRRRGTAA